MARWIMLAIEQVYMGIETPCKFKNEENNPCYFFRDGKCLGSENEYRSCYYSCSRMAPYSKQSQVIRQLESLITCIKAGNKIVDSGFNRFNGKYSFNITIKVKENDR